MHVADDESGFSIEPDRRRTPVGYVESDAILIGDDDCSNAI